MSRGLAKTSIYGEFLVLYLAVFNTIPNFGKVDVIMYVADSMENGAKSFRKNVESRYNESAFLKKYLPEVKFTDNDILFTNLGGVQTYVRMFGAKSGVRGFKMFGNRPVLAILDDLVSDEDANSPTQLDKIKDTIYNGVNQALNPMRKKIVLMVLRLIRMTLYTKLLNQVNGIVMYFLFVMSFLVVGRICRCLGIKIYL